MSKILFFFIILLSFNIQGKEFNNFSVDGINIKESLLNYTSRSNIKNEIANNWDWYADVGIDNKFVEVFFWSKVGIFFQKVPAMKVWTHFNRFKKKK